MFFEEGAFEKLGAFVGEEFQTKEGLTVRKPLGFRI
jgi:hypothetical protein